MLHMTTFVRPESTTTICDGLTLFPGVRHVMLGSVTSEGLVNITAQVDPISADDVLDLLARHDVDAGDVAFVRLPALQPRMRQPAGASDADARVWAEVVGRAWGNSRLGLVDLIFAIAAGVIAGVGVMTGSSILVVGAMAVSRDLLPITATAVGLVEREWRLASRSGRALSLGLATSAAAACVTVLILRLFGRVDENLVLADTVLGPSLTSLGPGSVLVALAAGVAAILAYERLSAAAVGVAISVTTIPAAAYVGDATALGRSAPVRGALLVLVTNVVGIITAASVTLWIQRRSQRAKGS